MSERDGTLLEKMIRRVERNRISTTEIADALGKSGVIHGMQSLNRGKHVTGRVSYVYAFDGSNWPVHEQIIDLDEDTIVYIDSFNCDEKAIFGDLVAKYLLLYKRVKGVVVNGLMRDIPNLRKHDYPIWCRGFSPLGCFNRKVTESEDLLRLVKERREYFEGGILTADDAGCTLIGPHLITEDTYARLDLIELQEDIWFFCIDTLKWNTYETVCLKRYLHEPEVLPQAMRQRLSEISFPV